MQTLDIRAAVQNAAFETDFRHLVTGVGSFRVEDPSLSRRPDHVGPVRTQHTEATAYPRIETGLREMERTVCPSLLQVYRQCCRIAVASAGVRLRSYLYHPVRELA